MKRLTYTVIGIHLGIILLMAIALPQKKKSKKPIAVQTFVAAAPKPAPPVKAPPPLPAKKVPAKPKPKPKPKPKAPPPKPKIAKKKSVKKAPPKAVIAPELLKELEMSIAKIEGKQAKSSPTKKLSAPKKITTLQIDQNTSDDAGRFGALLANCLQKQLALPEIGEVTVELTLTKSGKFVTMQVLKSLSDRNRTFLSRELMRVKFPPFEGSLKNEEKHTFVITFCNQ